MFAWGVIGKSGRAAARRSGRLSAAYLCAGFVLIAPALAEERARLDVERTGTAQDVRLERGDLSPYDARVTLVFDVDYLYRPSALMGEAVINCGAGVRNLRGSVEFEFDGDRHTVTVTDDNADGIRITNIDLLVGGGWTAITTAGYRYLRCNVGVPAQGDSPPFNVSGSPPWDALYCGMGLMTRFPPLAERERLFREWCGEFGGAYVDEATARETYAKESWHRNAQVFVGAIRVNVTDFVMAEVRRLRGEAEDDGFQAALDRLNRSYHGETPLDASEDAAAEDAGKRGERPQGSDTQSAFERLNRAYSEHQAKRAEAERKEREERERRERERAEQERKEAERQERERIERERAERERRRSREQPSRDKADAETQIIGCERNIKRGSFVGYRWIYPDGVRLSRKPCYYALSKARHR